MECYSRSLIHQKETYILNIRKLKTDQLIIIVCIFIMLPGIFHFFLLGFSLLNLIQYLISFFENLLRNTEYIKKFNFQVYILIFPL